MGIWRISAFWIDYSQTASQLVSGFVLSCEIFHSCILRKNSISPCKIKEHNSVLRHFLPPFLPAPFVFSRRPKLQIFHFRFENRLDDLKRPKVRALLEEIKLKIHAEDPKIFDLVENLKRLAANDLTEAVAQTFKLRQREVQISKRSKVQQETTHINSTLQSASLGYSKILKNAFAIIKSKKLRESNRTDVSRLSKDLATIFRFPSIMNSTKNQLIHNSEGSVHFKTLKRTSGKDTSSCKSSIRSKK